MDKTSLYSYLYFNIFLQQLGEYRANDSYTPSTTLDNYKFRAENVILILFWLSF